MITHQCGLLGVRIGEASHPGPRARVKHHRRVVSSSDDEPLVRPNIGRDVIPRTAPVSGTLPTWVDDERSQVPPTLPASGTLPTWVDDEEPDTSMCLRSREQSIPPTILDALEEDLEANVAEPAFIGGLNVGVGVPVIQIADADSDILSDTVSDPDSLRDDRIGNVVPQDSAESSDLDSVHSEREDHHAAVDEVMSDSAWDEIIVNRRTRNGFTSLDHVD